MFKVGDILIYRQVTGKEEECKVLHANPPGMRGFTVVQFDPQSMDGLCIPNKMLRKK